MSVLTRIRNNQILDATIYANAKIVPGSIVGSLFNSNLTTTSDVTIGGNLTVLGSSTYMTVASTNTYVNDPLIVLNNAFAGTNTYDLGFIFNRGVLTNQALIWDESEDEFRFIGTSETGTTYGNVSTGTFSNVRVGNISVQYYGTFGATVTVASGNVDVNYPAGGISTSGNVRIDGGHLTTPNTTFNLVDTNATTVNLARAATLLTVGATSGVAAIQNANIWLPNATTVGNGQDTLTLFALPATVTAFGKATLLTVGETSGTLVLNNPTVAHSQSTVSLFNSNVTVLNGLGAATTVNLGATSGVFQINNPTVAATQSTVALFNANVTTLNFAGAATTINMGANSGTLTIGNPTVVGTQTTQNLYNTTATTLNFAGAATTLTVGAATGLASIRNQVINLPNLTDLVTSQTSINVFNANVTTLNFAGDATTLSIGDAAGTTTINNAITAITGRANVNSSVDATTTTNAALTVAGGAGIAQTLIVGGGIFANSTTPSTTTSTGAVVVAGGVGVAGNINIGGNLLVNNDVFFNENFTVSPAGTTYFRNTTNSANAPETGAVQIVGGASISKDLFIGGNLYVSNVFSTGYTSLSVSDPLLYLTASNAFPYIYDIGTFSQFIGPDARTGAGNLLQHTGIVRDASDYTWKFFSNVAVEPGGTVTFDSDTQFDPVRAGNLTLTYDQEATSTTTGSFKTAGGIGVAGNIFIGGAYIDTSSSNFVFAQTSTTANLLSAGTSVQVGAAAGVFQVRNPNIDTVQATLNLFTANATTVNFASVGNVTLNTPTGTTTARGNVDIQSVRKSTVYTEGALTVAGGIGVTGNIFTNDSYLDTAQSNFLLLNTPTIVDAFKAGTDIEIGATSGTVIINNPTVRGSQTTQALYNTVTETINFGGAANINLGHTSGWANVRGSANVQQTVASTTYDTGAFLVQGGVGVRGNINVRSTRRISVGADIAPSVFADDLVSLTSNVNTISTAGIQNISASAGAAAEFTARNDLAETIRIGIVSSIFSDGNANIFQSNDSYIFSNNPSGNLLVASASTGKEVRIYAGGVNTTNHFATFSDNTANVSIVKETISTSHTTGAFTVTGGVGFGSNLYVARGAVFNNTEVSTGLFQVKGRNDDALIIADPTRDSVVIGGTGNTTVQPGIGLKVGGNGAIMIPVGTNTQRPGTAGNVDVDGMMRLNSTSNQLEYYIGGQWSVAGSSFTLIQTDTFNGDGANVAFTLGASSTTTGAIVSINGVLQIPVTSYSISGTALTFTEAPAVGDAIDVRRLTTTSTVDQLSNGFTVFNAQPNWGNIQTGTPALATSIDRLSISNDGEVRLDNHANLVYNQYSGTNIAANATPYVVASFSQTTYTTAKYIVQVKNGATNFQSMEALLVTDQSGNAYVTTYAVVTNGTQLGTLSANVVAGNVRLYYTNNHPSGINSNVKVQSTYII